MSRRSGQVGSIERKGNSFRARFWLDVPGSDKRVYKSVLIAPVSGPGSLNKFELKRRLKEIVDEAGANDEVTLRTFEAVTLSTTFKQQAAMWMETVQRRKRKPIKPGTARSWESALQWLNPQIGEMPLSAVNNLAVRDHVVTRMSTERIDGAPRFAPKTISNYLQVVKMVVASALTDDGEEMYPVKWNHDFIDLPEILNQHKPMFAADEVNEVIARSDGQFSVLYALLAGTGLRIGEALALKVGDVRDNHIVVSCALDAATNHIQTPKTKNGVREVDVHSSLAVALSALAATRTGFLFINDAGNPLWQTSLLEHLHPILDSIGRVRCGFHSFRRFRNTHLRKARVPDGLIQFWMGHAAETMTDEYDMVREDREFRRFTAEQVGLGFEPPQVRRTVGSELHPLHPEAEPVNL